MSGEAWPLEKIKWSFAGLSGCPKSYRKCPASKTAMRSAAERDDVGCPEPAAVEHRMLSTRSCRARSRYSSIFVSVCAAVATSYPYRTIQTAKRTANTDQNLGRQAEKKASAWK